MYTDDTNLRSHADIVTETWNWIINSLDSIKYFWILKKANFNLAHCNSVEDDKRLKMPNSKIGSKIIARQMSKKFLGVI